MMFELPLYTKVNLRIRCICMFSLFFEIILGVQKNEAEFWISSNLEMISLNDFTDSRRDGSSRPDSSLLIVKSHFLGDINVTN